DSPARSRALRNRICGSTAIADSLYLRVSTAASQFDRGENYPSVLGVRCSTFPTHPFVGSIPRGVRIIHAGTYLQRGIFKMKTRLAERDLSRNRATEPH